MPSIFRRSALPCALFALLLSGCSSTPEERALEDIRDTTIIPNLGSYDDGVQKEAVARMLNILDTAPDVGANLLVASLRDPVHDDRTKTVCAWLLSTVNDRRALPYLMTFLGQGSNSGESLVREAVSSYGASVIPSVTEVLNEGGDLARIAAAEVLFELGTREAVDALVARLEREPEARVRFLILCGVANERPPRVAPLEQTLNDDDPSNREFAWDTLARAFRFPDWLTFDPQAEPEVRRQQIERYQAWRAGQG